MGCFDSELEKSNLACLRSKSTEEIYNATWTVKSLFNNVLGDMLADGKLTQLAEPYAPVIGEKFLEKHPYDFIKRRVSRWRKSL